MSQHLSQRASQVLKRVQRGERLRNGDGNAYYFEKSGDQVNQSVVNQLLARDCTLHYTGNVHYVTPVSTSKGK